MNRERLEELKTKIDNVVKAKDQRLYELQQEITDCNTKINQNVQLMNEAQGKEDPDTYERAFALTNMYRDKLQKAEQEQIRLSNNPAIRGNIYDEVKDFITKDSIGSVEEERVEIWEHIAAILEITEKYKDYTQELNLLAHECERVNRASYTGAYNLIPVSSIPGHWLDVINEAAYFFRPKSEGGII